ncbi:MAG: hypothetical protein GXP14_09035 [Gammaproteobacteria bacterium]|nr:hypothetical protein [Gammaproteobacteria bacterium]
MNTLSIVKLHVVLVFLVLVNIFTVFSVQADALALPEFGRIFTTEKERQRIDQSRLRSLIQSGEVSDMASPEKPTVLPIVMMQGFVKRSNGKNVVWVNNENTLNNRLKQKGIRVNTHNIRDNQVDLSVAGKRVRLKPGQTLQKESAGIIKIYKHL